MRECPNSNLMMRIRGGICCPAGCATDRSAIHAGGCVQREAPSLLLPCQPGDPRPTRIKLTFSPRITLRSCTPLYYSHSRPYTSLSLATETHHRGRHITTMGGANQPFLYESGQYNGRFPESTFDPKAVTRASWESKPPKPKQDGPLLSFNRHPEYVEPRHSSANPPCLLTAPPVRTRCWEAGAIRR